MTGGLRSPVWVLFITVAIFVADVVERKGLAAFAALGMGMLLAASVASGTFSVEVLPWLVAALRGHSVGRWLRRDAEDGDSSRTSRSPAAAG